MLGVLSFLVTPIGFKLVVGVVIQREVGTRGFCLRFGRLLSFRNYDDI